MSNTFAEGSGQYAAARPLYPTALFEWVAAACRNRDAAWDCATGNGQAATGLARYFAQVEATDLSEAQVGQGFEAPNIRYSAQPAESTGFANASFDLVAVAQALHWFDYDRFWPEVRRVARPGALFCAWGYAWFRGAEAVRQGLLDPLAEIVQPYWADNNRLLWRGYRPEEVRFPFDPVQTPALRLEVNWSTRELAAYVRTWSAFKRAAADGNSAALEHILGEAQQALGPETRHDLWVPIAMIAGYVA